VLLATLPEAWESVAASLVANHLVLFVAGLIPRSRLLGENLSRLPEAARVRGEIALTFDDGPDPDTTPRVLDLLDAVGASASFFCVGERVAAHPALVREIVRRGHTVENHSQHHSVLFSCYGPSRLKRELAAAQATLTDATGVAPVFFRAPFGLRNPLLDPALARLGLRYVSWTRRGFDAVSADATRAVARLTRNLAAGDLLVLHDGVATLARHRGVGALGGLPAVLARVGATGLKPVTLRAACDL
jgi:peptidoglycan/xylan/chitin deacetylase (PgdA/CDA1 family)